MTNSSSILSSLKWVGSRWWLRHLVVLALAVIGVYLFQESRAKWSEMHRWNRAFGDMSVVLICLAMATGPLARLWTELRVLIPWRRECGIYGIVLALVHTVIILAGWVEWDLVRLFGYEIHPELGQYVMVQHGLGLANVIGLIALLYGMVLASSSNNLSVRVLGNSVWKFLQQGSYVLWMLILLHTAYFLYFHFLHFHRPLPKPNWAQWPFVLLVLTILALQGAAFLKTWRTRHDRQASMGRRKNA